MAETSASHLAQLHNHENTLPLHDYTLGHPNRYLLATA